MTPTTTLMRSVPGRSRVERHHQTHPSRCRKLVTSVKTLMVGTPGRTVRSGWQPDYSKGGKSTASIGRGLVGAPRFNCDVPAVRRTGGAHAHAAPPREVRFGDSPSKCIVRAFDQWQTGNFPVAHTRKIATDRRESPPGIGSARLLGPRSGFVCILWP
jgi:hypothetical protein